MLTTTSATVFACSQKLGILDQFTLKNSLIIANVNATTIFLFCTVMMLVALGFYLLQCSNLLLQKVVESPECCDKLKIIKLVSLIHVKICESLDEISKLFLLFFLDLLTAFVVFQVFSNFSLFIYINNPRENILAFFVSGTTWIIQYSPCVIWLLSYINWMSQAFKTTACLVSKLVHSESSEKEMKRASCLLLQMAHRTPKVSCGLFELSWNFCFLMLGTIFSMTIIFIQFYDVPTES